MNLPLALKTSVFSIALILISQTGQAAVVAQFTGGDGTASVDQYKGIAGDGWATPWSSRNGSNGVTTIGVQSTTPFGEGMGNYLQLHYIRNATPTATNRAGVAREFARVGPGSIDTTKPYTISFDFRPDLLTGWSAATDQIVFSSEQSATIGSPVADTPWAIQIRADTGWNIFSGNGTGTLQTTNLTSLGLTGLTVGQIYSITVYMDPLQNAFDLTVTTGGVTYRASEANGDALFGFRTSSTAATASFLQFRMVSDANGDAFQFSLDNVAVIPEPGSVGMAMGGVLLLGAYGLRKSARR